MLAHSSLYDCLAFYTTLDSHISSGPIWPDVDVDPSCQSRWWWNILYINNFLAASEQCMGWAWYLANDMQFYVICPLFLIALWRRPVIGYSLLGVTFAASTITTFVLSYEYNLFSGLGNIVRVVDDIEDFCFVGILLAYCIYKTRQNGSFKLHKITLYLGWIVASTITLACMYGLYHRDQSRVEIAFYNSFSRTCFAFGLAWVIFVCVTDQGGVVNNILSWKALIPLSRLTYCAYLVHPIVEILYFASVKQLIHFQHITLVIYFLGFLFVSYAAALVTSLLFESPVIRLERLIRNKFTARE
ncbi:nose resistant to fluoxetine protein 6 [Caerostris extrusa]|uniref:Nose resistant to fluoxetine protein 6 n=1 Tax=Caerostris extrusa TaxID=172846 RepID=A0AAV4RJF3_CAEEX|nr:nose resistant to fluoxetine protein 6 [Caerostris extrusa]